MKPLTIALSGIEEQAARDFHTTFKALNGRFGRSWAWADTDSDDADLVVIDIDTVYGHMDWLKATASGLRTALFTAAERANDADLILGKPLQVDALAQILATVAMERGVRLDADGSPPAVTVAAAAASAEIAESVETTASVGSERSRPRLVAASTAVGGAVVVPARTASAKPALASAAKTRPALAAVAVATSEPSVEAPLRTIADWLVARRAGQPMRIEAHDQAWIVDPERDSYYGPTTLKPLHDVLQRPIASLQPVTVTALEQARKHAGQPLARLRWFAALSATPGALSTSLEADASYKLSRWPQIEREFPRHFRIATAMMKRTGCIEDIASASGAPQADVLDFINAYHALGYIAVDGDMGEDANEATRGVMSRLRNSFAR